MSSLSREDIRRIQEHARRHRIDFVGELERQYWPSYHHKLFEEICHIRTETFERYASDPDASNYWKKETKQLARLLSNQAKRSQGVNEATWRQVCEPIIFRRSTGDVVCRTCRNKTWKLEIEAICDWVNKSGLKSRKVQLPMRRTKRERCTCPKVSRDFDLNEATGMSEIFGLCSEVPVVIEEDLRKTLGNKGLKPDVVYALRPTRKFENVLYDKARYDENNSVRGFERVVCDILKPCPLDMETENMLFPFMVVEAKSGRAGADWHAVNMQTAFPIRAFLQAQYRLWTASDACTQAHTRPLLWYLSNKGRDVCVSIAYLEFGPDAYYSANDVDIKIAEVWHGSIENQDNALQLLLIMDFIFDWAREDYRENIYKQIRDIASGENDNGTEHYSTAETTTVTDGFHTDGFHPLIQRGVSSIQQQYPMHADGELPFIEREASLGIVRHASFIRTEFHAFVLTRDNAEICLHHLIRLGLRDHILSILDQMSTSIRVDSATLQETEERWTGKIRDNPIFADESTEFFALISCTNCITSQWTLVRELYVFAVSTDMWDIVLERVRGNSAVQPLLTKPLLPKSSVIDAVLQLQAESSGKTLLSCIQRECVELKRGYSSTISVQSMKTVGAFRDIAFQLAHLISDNQLVIHDTFYRQSYRLDQQSISGTESHWAPESETVDRSLASRNPGPLPHSPYTLVYRDNVSNHDSPCRKICLYICCSDMQVPSQQEIARLFKTTFETQLTYSTEGFADQLHISPYSTRPPWNRDVIWEYCTDIGILEYLSNVLCKESPPTRQMAPRLIDGATSALYLHRLIEPISGRTELEPEKMFLYFILVSRELEYWKNRRTSRKKKKRWMCLWCDETEPRPRDSDGTRRLCQACFQITQDKNYVFWFRNLWAENPVFTDDTRIFEPMREKWTKALLGYEGLNHPVRSIPDLLEQYGLYRLWLEEKGGWDRKFPPSREKELNKVLRATLGVKKDNMPQFDLDPDVAGMGFDNPEIQDGCSQQ